MKCPAGCVFRCMPAPERLSSGIHHFLKNRFNLYTVHCHDGAVGKKQISVKELGKCLFLDSGTLTPLLKKLEQKGYVTRTRSEEDERVLIAAITPKGEDLKDEAVLIPQKMMACAALPQEKAAQLYTLLYELLNTLEKIESKLKKGGKPYCYSFSRP